MTQKWKDMKKLNEFEHLMYIAKGLRTYVSAAIDDIDGSVSDKLGDGLSAVEALEAIVHEAEISVRKAEDLVSCLDQANIECSSYIMDYLKKAHRELAAMHGAITTTVGVLFYTDGKSVGDHLNLLNHPENSFGKGRPVEWDH